MKTETEEELQERLRREAAKKNREYRPMSREKVQETKRLLRGLAALERWR